MRIPVRSESEAFRLLVASALAIAASVLIGWLTRPLVGAAALALLALLALIAYLRAANPDRRTALRDAAGGPHPHGARVGTRHLLLVANETLGGDELLERIMRTDGEHVEVDVLAPVLTSRLHYAMSDIDGELTDARTRLDRSLAWAREQGINVTRSEIGGPSPTVAIEDELRDFGADEVIVVTRSRERATRQERGELERLRRELDVPVTCVTAAAATTAQA